jgi:hypothetical protein
MKVTIDYGQSTQGLFGTKPKFDVRVRTELTAEEVAAVKHVALQQSVILRYERKGLQLDCTVGQLLNGGAQFAFDDFIEARHFTQEVKERLNVLKGVIVEAIAVKEGRSETFEL